MAWTAGRQFYSGFALLKEPQDFAGNKTRIDSDTRCSCSSRDSLEHRQRRPNMPGDGRQIAPDRTAWLLARRAGGQARRSRLLGTCGRSPVARLEYLREKPAIARRTVFLFGKSDTFVLGHAARIRRRRRVDLWMREHGSACGTSAKLSRSGRWNADPVLCHPLAESFEQRCGCAL